MDVIATPAQRDLLTVCALRHDRKVLDWHLVARTCQSPELLATVLGGDFPETSPVATKNLQTLRHALKTVDDARARADHEIEVAAQAGAQLTTVLDSDYPANLRLVPDLPPFLFCKGSLEPRDARSVAVVGTRQASDLGLRRAARMARGLAEHDVVINSGLAAGIDGAAHTATLDAGGRTVAVMGTGIAKPVYPAQHRGLAQRILDSGGALVSQFWPSSSAATWTFPRRNVTMSGMSMGTVVVEASSTSGAKMQARIAAEHGKQVWVLRSLVDAQPWAATMFAEGRATRVDDLDDVLDDVDTIVSRLASSDAVIALGQQRYQLALIGLTES
jgi:DNA processing protein